MSSVELKFLEAVNFSCFLKSVSTWKAWDLVAEFCLSQGYQPFDGYHPAWGSQEKGILKVFL